LLSVLLILEENEELNSIEIPVELCRSAKIEFVRWSAQIETQNLDLKTATDQIDMDRERLIRNFTAKGLNRNEIEFLPVVVDSETDSLQTWNKVVQKMEIKSPRIQLLRKIINESSDLLRFNVQFTSLEIKYELANFRNWLLDAIPRLIENGNTLASQSLSKNEYKQLKLKKLRIKPFFSDNYETCDVPEAFVGQLLPNDSITVRIKSTIEFVIR